MDDLIAGCLALAKEMEGLAADHEAEVVGDPLTTAAHQRGMASAYLLAAKWLRELVEANVEPEPQFDTWAEQRGER